MKISGFQGIDRLGGGQGRGKRAIRPTEEAPAQFRSPSTGNALKRFEARIGRIAGNENTELDALVRQIRDRLSELSATDQRPFGKSIEHEIKQLLIHALRRGEEAQATEPEEPVVIPAPPEEEIVAEADNLGDGTTTLSLDRTV